LPLGDSILIERWAVQYTPGLALLSHAQQKAPRNAILLMGSIENGFGDPPLRDIDLELTELAEIWGGSDHAVECHLVERNARPADIGWPPSRWADFKVVHLACHGVFPEGRPFDAALRLGGDAIRGSELFAAKLDAEVVALSACALGQRAQRWGDTEIVGEEWIGLYLPLFYAGARSLVVSLWNADSYLARRFMVALHGALAEGAAPDIAFQAAVLSVRRKLAPLWANWYLVGSPQLNPAAPSVTEALPFATD
jgi:CHAT domain-containing protein